MPLFIRDARVDALAAELQAAMGARTKTETVRTALQRELARRVAPAPHPDRVERILDMVRGARPAAPPPGDRTDFLYDENGLPR